MTFISEIDNSVQYFGVTPGTTNDEEGQPMALFLSLHGAGVEAGDGALEEGDEALGLAKEPPRAEGDHGGDREHHRAEHEGPDQRRTGPSHHVTPLPCAGIAAPVRGRRDRGEIGRAHV